MGTLTTYMYLAYGIPNLKSLRPCVFALVEKGSWVVLKQEVGCIVRKDITRARWSNRLEKRH